MEFCSVLRRSHFVTVTDWTFFAVVQDRVRSDDRTLRMKLRFTFRRVYKKSGIHSEITP
jgi:hypothetical protein